RTNSSLIAIESGRWLSVSVIFPSPTSSLPDHLKMAPVPEEGPSNEFLAFGSSFAQGDQASQLWKSLTCLKTSAGGAEIVVARTIRKSAGCTATTPAKTTTAPTRRSTTKAMTLRTGDFFFEPDEAS